MSNLLDSRIVLTRKPHRCSGCLAEIAPKTRVSCLTATDCSKLFSYYLCLVCEEYCDKHFAFGDTFLTGEIRANDPEGWEAVRDEIMKEGTEL